MAMRLNLRFLSQNRNMPSAARLCHFIENWLKLLKDLNVLEIAPRDKNPIHKLSNSELNCNFSKSQLPVIDLEIAEMLKKKEIVKVSPCPDQVF